MCVKKHSELDTCQKVYSYNNMGTDYELDNDKLQARNALLNSTGLSNLLKTAIG